MWHIFDIATRMNKILLADIPDIFVDWHVPWHFLSPFFGWLQQRTLQKEIQIAWVNYGIELINNVYYLW